MAQVSTPEAILYTLALTILDKTNRRNLPEWPSVRRAYRGPVLNGMTEIQRSLPE